MLLAANPAAAALDPQLRPVDLQVTGGEDAWHAENDFRLEWDPPGVAVSAVNYRVRDSRGELVAPAVRVPWNPTLIESILVSPEPGVYTVELWLEGTGGTTGPEVSANLRFDDVRPGAARPLAPAGWVSASRATLLRIEAPTGPPPLSGIRGYAVSVDSAGEATPCSVPGWCSLAETDLYASGADDTISLGILPEGSSVVHVLAVSGSGMSSGQTESVIVHVDGTRPGLRLAGVPPDWARGPVRLTATATDSLSGMAANGPEGPHTAIAVDGGVPRSEYGDSSTAMVTGEGIHRISSFARDAAGNSSERSPLTAVVRIDESGPDVAFARAEDARDPERIEATARDPLSGVVPGRGSIAVRPAGSRQRWEPLPTSGAGTLVARWNSDSFPPGTYEFRATAHDTAGNAATTDRRANGARMVLSNPLKARTAITAGFGDRRLVWQRCSRGDGQRRCRRQAIDSVEQSPTTSTVSYGRGIAFGGRLSGARGTRLGGLPIEIVESFDSGASSPLRTTVIQTDDHGTFLTRLAAGPSRQVEVVFAGTRTLSRASGGGQRLQALAGVRMRASSASALIGGAPVVFHGRLGDLGAPIPPGGHPVELQFRLAGREWSEFRTVQTDAQGRFRYPYSFSDDDSRGIRFQFRAYVPAQADWPYEPAASRPVFVTGR
jgi:hypothetical protein